MNSVTSPLPAFTERVPAVFRTAGSRLAGFIGLVFLFTACRTAPPPEGAASARGSVLVETSTITKLPVAEEAKAFNQFRSQTFEGYGAGKLPGGISGSAQGRAFAQAEARRAALRTLAQQIVDFGAGGKSAFLTIAGDSKDWQPRLEEQLEHVAEIDYKTREGIEMARARIEGVKLFGPLPAMEGVEAKAPLFSDLQQRRMQAREKATESARQFLYEDLMTLGTRRGIFGGQRAPSSRFSKALRAEVDQVEPFSVEYGDDGRCIVELRYDRSEIANMND